MRLFLIALVLLISRVGRAQVFDGPDFEGGYYVLIENQTVRQPGQLKLRSGSKLVAKNEEGKNLKLTPAQVCAFQIGVHRYITAHNFRIGGGLGGSGVDLAFVEQVDSGQVVLLRYDYFVGGGTVGGGGAIASPTPASAYLLRRAPDEIPLCIQGNANRFRELLQPFLTSRPDLAQLVGEQLVKGNELPAIIHALNSGQPFVLPPSRRKHPKKENPVENPFGTD